MKIDNNQRSCGVSLLLTLGIVIFLSTLALPFGFAADTSKSPEVKATTQSSGGLWDKMKDEVNKIGNPLSEISIRDAGVKPRIRPHLFVDTSFNSNANASKKQVGAWQARVSPGVTLELPVSNKLYVMNDYTYSFATTQGPRYSDNNNNHNLTSLIRYDLTKCTTLGVNNNFQISDLPDNAGKRFLLETVKPEIQHRFGERLRGTLNYQFQHFRDVGPLEWSTGDSTVTRSTYNENSIGSSLTYEATRKLNVSPNFNWGIRHFPKESAANYWYIRPDMQATYGLGAKTTLTGHFGWGYRRFRQGAYSSDLIFGAGINHLLGRKMVWGINYDKSQQDTFDTRFINRDTPIATNLDNFDRHFRVINVHRLGTSLAYNLNESNTISTFGDFVFTDTRRVDNIADNTSMNNEKKMETGLMYKYRMTRYLDFRLGYTFGRGFDSDNNTSRNAYTFHKVTAGTNVSF